MEYFSDGDTEHLVHLEHQVTDRLWIGLRLDFHFHQCGHPRGDTMRYVDTFPFRILP